MPVKKIVNLNFRSPRKSGIVECKVLPLIQFLYKQYVCLKFIKFRVNFFLLLLVGR